MSTDHLTEVAKAAPAVLVAGVGILTRIPINGWVGMATLLYLVAQFIVLVRREIRETRLAEQWQPERRKPKGPVGIVARALMRPREKQ